jgi:hypothetical protein
MTTAAEILALVERIQAKSSQPVVWLINPKARRKWRRTLRKLQRVRRFKRSVNRAYRRANLSLPTL